MRVGSLFAGIGGFDLAAERAGMEVVWQSEIDPHASRVLAHHWPEVTNYGDIHHMGLEDGDREERPGVASGGDGLRPRSGWPRGYQTTHLPDGGTDGGPLPGVDVLTGGFPCQDYSVAGNRGGLAGDRGALWWEYHRLITALRPTWVVGENVPGLLSSRSGRDFETIVGSLIELGYGVAWAVLDAQYFGVAQRRRRVFIVGHIGGEPRPEILALSEGLFGHPRPRRETGQDIAGTLAPGSQSGGQRSTDLDGHGAWVVEPLAFDSSRRDGVRLQGDSEFSVENEVAPVVGVDQRPAVVYSEGGMENYQEVDAIHPMTADGPGSRRIEQIVFAQNQREEVRDIEDLAVALNSEPGSHQQTYVAKTAFTASNGWGILDDGTTHTVDSSGPEAVVQAWAMPTVRRLTPTECERLQGFPDNWTNVPGASDTQRYRQLGNAVAVPVVEWLLKRVAAHG